MIMVCAWNTNERQSIFSHFMQYTDNDTKNDIDKYTKINVLYHIWSNEHPYRNISLSPFFQSESYITWSEIYI